MLPCPAFYVVRVCQSTTESHFTQSSFLPSLKELLLSSGWDQKSDVMLWRGFLVTGGWDYLTGSWGKGAEHAPAREGTKEKDIGQAGGAQKRSDPRIRHVGENEIPRPRATLSPTTKAFGMGSKWLWLTALQQQLHYSVLFSKHAGLFPAVLLNSFQGSLQSHFQTHLSLLFPTCRGQAGTEGWPQPLFVTNLSLSRPQNDYHV